MTTSLNPIDRLEHLASIRTARTDQLHAATVNLFARLRGLVPVGTSVTIGRVSLNLNRVRSNAGSDVCWNVVVDFQTEDELYCSDIERPVGEKGFLHGDFHCPWSGPSRALLIEVGRIAPELVQALIDQTEVTCEALDVAAARVNVASQEVP
jgi:hypothetical protein